MIFAVVAFLLLHKNKKNLKRHGWIFLYHSQFGLKFIEWTSKTFEKILKPLQYVVVASGYILMAGIVWLMGLSVWRYITTDIPEQLKNVPPVAPLIPYFPKLFGLESFFPPLYFTYFLIALAIVAVSHEFAHGIFARLNGIKVKTTGLAFFGPFFGAFVEPDEKQMAKKGKFQQLSVLAAGTFANVVMTLLFLIVLALFFSASFQAAGVKFNAYPQAAINVESITGINGNLIDSLEEGREFFADEGLNEISIDEKIFLVPSKSLEVALETEAKEIIVFDDAPAIREKLNGPILAIDGEIMTSPESLAAKLSEYSPGDMIKIRTFDETGMEITKEIELSEKDGRAYLGIGFIRGSDSGLSGAIFSVIQSIRDPLVYYEPSWDGEFVQFIYDLLWWIVMINILVALFNMLPVSILDGGRFFYLTVWGITGRETWGRKAYQYATWIILFMLVLMVVRWAFNFA
ncbi:hypothetical protein AUJ64_00535 [Candidatus Pacearchaeota archaeon CG1_02_39_14]|nr:MAG: hypothetical protein AUJ64_00535 [Candidatus Pacearchaeota archaeon CG1_02_39_14]